MTTIPSSRRARCASEATAKVVFTEVESGLSGTRKLHERLHTHLPIGRASCGAVCAPNHLANGRLEDEAPPPEGGGALPRSASDDLRAGDLVRNAELVHGVVVRVRDVREARRRIDGLAVEVEQVAVRVRIDAEDAEVADVAHV